MGNLLPMVCGVHLVEDFLNHSLLINDEGGANNAHVRSILVRAIHNHNIWLKLRHVAELPFIIAAGKRSV